MLSKSVGDKGKFMHEMMANLSLAGSGTDVSAVNFVRSNSVSSASGRTGINYPSFMSPNAAPFYPAGETVESVIGVYEELSVGCMHMISAFFLVCCI